MLDSQLREGKRTDVPLQASLHLRPSSIFPQILVLDCKTRPRTFVLGPILRVKINTLITTSVAFFLIGNASPSLTQSF